MDTQFRFVRTCNADNGEPLLTLCQVQPEGDGFDPQWTQANPIAATTPEEYAAQMQGALAQALSLPLVAMADVRYADVQPSDR